MGNWRLYIDSIEHLQYDIKLFFSSFCLATRKTNLALNTWLELWTYLTVVYRDGVKIEANEPGTDHGGEIMGGETGKVTYGTGIGNGEWPDDWK